MRLELPRRRTRTGSRNRLQPVENIQKRIAEVAPATEDVMASALEQLIQQGKAEVWNAS
jgi:hypothetical protein